MSLDDEDGAKFDGERYGERSTICLTDLGSGMVIVNPLGKRFGGRKPAIYVI